MILLLLISKIIDINKKLIILNKNQKPEEELDNIVSIYMIKNQKKIQHIIIT
jgi:hypothetical protein